MSRIKDGISQATASTEGTISAEGNIGKNKTSGSIDSEEIWNLGIDFKVGGLGITNDYGGAITISIAGQSITWGREGGKIHYDLGGFEVIVEARDCVVTETKLIMGIEVASHTYPDPGCKLPEEEPEPPEPPPSPSNPTNKPLYRNCNGGRWVLTHEVYMTDSKSFKLFPIEEALTRRAAASEPTPERHAAADLAAYHWNGRSDWIKKSFPNKSPRRELVGNWNWVSPSNQLPRFGSDIRTSNRLAAWIEISSERYLYFYPEANIDDAQTSFMAGVFHSYSYVVVDVILDPPVCPNGELKPQPFLRPGVPPQIKNDCCEEILDSLDDLKDVLHVDFFKKEKFPVPSYLLAPGVDPSKTTVANNYYNLFQKLFQALAHSTIVSPKIDIQDADAVKEGDQPINSEYLSATGWAEAITKMLYEIVDDGNVGTNMDIRTGVTVTQLLVAVADLSYKVDCIIDCIGVTTKRSKGEVETSYNLVVEGDNTKGFDPKKANQKLDLNSDISTDKLLSSLLRTRKNPIVKEEIHPKSPTLFEILQDLKQK